MHIELCVFPISLWFIKSFDCFRVCECGSWCVQGAVSRARYQRGIHVLCSQWRPGLHRATSLPTQCKITLFYFYLDTFYTIIALLSTTILNCLEESSAVLYFLWFLNFGLTQIFFNVAGWPKQEVTCASPQWRMSCQKHQNVGGAILFALAKWHQDLCPVTSVLVTYVITACQAVECPGSAQSCEAFDATGHRVA